MSSIEQGASNGEFSEIPPTVQDWLVHVEPDPIVGETIAELRLRTIMISAVFAELFGDPEKVIPIHTDGSPFYD